MVQLLHPYMSTGKTIDLTIWTFVDKVISLLFNTLSRFVIGFFPRSKRLLISWLQSPSAVILDSRKIKSDTVSTLSPSIINLFNLYAEYIMRNAGLEETQAGIKITGRNINNLRYADNTILMAESEEELKSLLMKVKEESEKVGLKLSIQKMKIMASGPITSWQIDGETVETVADFIFFELQNHCRW